MTEAEPSGIAPALLGFSVAQTGTLHFDLPDGGVRDAFERR